MRLSFVTIFSPMSLPKPKILLTVLLGLILIGIGWRFGHELSFRDSTIVFTKGEPVKILPGETITQTFKPKSGTLTKLEFLVRNPEPKPSDRVTVTVADKTCETTLRETTLKPGYLDSDNLFVARFEPLPTASSEPLCAILTFDKKKYQSEFLRFFTHESTPASFLDLTLAGISQPGQSLALRPVYTYPTLSQNLSQLNDRISQYKPWFLKDGFLTFITLVFIGSTLTLLVLLIFKPGESQ